MVLRPDNTVALLAKFHHPDLASQHIVLQRFLSFALAMMFHGGVRFPQVPCWARGNCRPQNVAGAERGSYDCRNTGGADCAAPNRGAQVRGRERQAKKEPPSKILYTEIA